ncbi:amidohydrolase family protein [Bittarella sp. HCP28S3_D9]|uniref:amidohydrolase family protein n=1 Tax=Bittarella sp. HCP28S3_D9 TaxID=3440253 RepID=UPI003F8C51E5
MKRAFTHVNAVDVLAHKVLADCTVLVEDGKIVEIGQGVDTAGSEVIDLAEKYMTPGLFNCHVHLWSNSTPVQTDLLKMTEFDKALFSILNCEKLIKTGVTFVRDVGTSNRAACDLKKNILGGTIRMAPDLQVVASAICMTGGATWNVGACQADGVDECMKATRLQLREGADFIKLYSSGSVLTAGMDPNSPQLTVEELTACVKVAHDAAKKTCCHAQNARSIKNAVIAGVDHIEHGIGLDDESVEMMLAQGTWLDPTVSALYNIARHADRLIPEVREKALRLEHAAYASFKKAYRAGIPCACGNDAGSSFCEFDDTASEMVTMVEKCDLTPAEALAIGTINSAKMLDVEDELGSITVGKKAHLAVFDENPLNDIHALESCFMTVKNGEILYTRA